MDAVSAFFGFLGGQLAGVFLPVGSSFSILSLASALLVAGSWLAVARWRRGRAVRLKTLRRLLLPQRFKLSPSTTADLGLFVFNVFLYGLILGWAVLSFHWLSVGVSEGLTAWCGPGLALPPVWSRVLLTGLIFLAYEFGYWVDHYLSHRFAVLWEFHKVHHTANELTPWTVWRVHPFETLKFYNIVALATALANGVGHFAFGSVDPYTISGNNVILVVFVYGYIHLQHTELWIAFSGWLGRLLQSPAHHQVHHSLDPRHHNKNLGSCLAVWDWMFGTLYVPGRVPEKLRFGLHAAQGAEAHTIGEVMFNPVWRAAKRFTQPLRKLSKATAAPTSRHRERSEAIQG